jgi:glycosyltransferase involved in cell wall biosynthesis
MDVCAITSAAESFGLVSVEAYDAGKPVIAFAGSGGLAEIVSKFSHADIVSTQQEFSDRLNFYFDHPDNDADKRKAFAAEFDIQITSQKFFDLYSAICAA